MLTVMYVLLVLNDKLMSTPGWYLGIAAADLVFTSAIVLVAALAVSLARGNRGSG